MKKISDYSGHAESTERKELLQRLLAIQSSKDREKEFLELSREKSLSLVLNVNIATLPAEDVPLNWDDNEEKATVATAEWIKKAYQQPSGKDAEEDSDNDSGTSVDGMYEKGNRCKPEVPYLDFSDRLRYCYPMTSGFHNEDGNGAFCYCPCGKGMADWRKLVGVQDFLEQEDRYGGNPLCKSGNKLLPRQLLQHVKAIKERCRAHEIIWHFLNGVFENYYEKGIRHIAFEKENSQAYKRVLEVRQSRKRPRYDEELVVGKNLAEGEVVRSSILEEGEVGAAKKPSAA
jgi:hypothetical protein